SILQKQKSRDPSLGYAKDFVPLMERILPIIVERGIKVTANAGGVNPRACAQAVAEVARRLKLGGRLRIGVVTGDDLLPRLDGLMARGHELRNLDTGRPLSAVRDRVLAANAYLGARPLVDALRRRADVVITGRVTDTGLTLAPMIHAFDWRPDAWDLLAAGTVAGHTIECGAQCSGGNCLVGWDRIPDLANVGYPIVDARPDGTFEISKHPGTGGRISVAGVTEQLVYEMGDPAAYITPDCIADFTTIRLEPVGRDRVRVSVARAKPAVERFTREIAPLILNGPPSVTGFAGGRPKPEEIVAYWPALLDKSMVEPCVELVEV